MKKLEENVASELNSLLTAIDQLYTEMYHDAMLLIEKGNRSAGRRSRKASIAIEGLLKEWRKKSVV